MLLQNLFPEGPGLWCWVFEDVKAIDPFPMTGKQGWAILTEEEKKKIRIIEP